MSTRAHDLNHCADFSTRRSATAILPSLGRRLPHSTGAELSIVMGAQKEVGLFPIMCARRRGPARRGQPFLRSDSRSSDVLPRAALSCFNVVTSALFVARLQRRLASDGKRKARTTLHIEPTCLGHCRAALLRMKTGLLFHETAQKSSIRTSNFLHLTATRRGSARTRGRAPGHVSLPAPVPLGRARHHKLFFFNLERESLHSDSSC